MNKMRSHSPTKIQHYVPRFLLRNFTKGDKQQIWVYDKQTRKSYRTNIKNVAAENGFYDLEIEDISITLEPHLGRLETNSSKLISRVIEDGSIAWLSITDRIVLSAFILAQQIRTKHLRENMLHMDKAFQEKISEMGLGPDQIENYRPLREEGARLLSIKMLTDQEGLVRHIIEKEWMLLKGRPDNPFYISDNPIALQNTFGPRKTLGLAVEGIEIYLPISSTFTIAMYCPSITNKIREGYRRYKHVSMTMPWIANTVFKDDPFYLEKMVTALNEGVAAECVDDNILNLNYLQVQNAERQVYCEQESFWLVKDMLEQDPIYRRGPRIKIS